jgi:hypothetical protein
MRFGSPVIITGSPAMGLQAKVLDHMEGRIDSIAARTMPEKSTGRMSS